jgi:hypothetical protein
LTPENEANREMARFSSSSSEKGVIALPGPVTAEKAKLSAALDDHILN